MPKTLSDAWDVLVLFLIPIGGGIPGGVLLAKSKGIEWPEMTLLYLISDMILACIFEPLMLLSRAGAKRSAYLSRVGAAFKKSTEKTLAYYGNKRSPLALILIAFGVDPMTGRIVAAAAGHGFIPGWALAITGDMFYYAMLMVSTLFLRNVLGDGTAATIIILVVMTIGPMLWRKLREKFRRTPQ